MAVELARERERNRRLRAVVDAGSLLSLDLTELAEHILAAASDLVGAERGRLYLLEGDHLQALAASSVDPLTLRVPIGEGIVGTVARTGRAALLDRPDDDPRFDPQVDGLTGLETRSLLTVPVTGPGGGLVAVLQLSNRTDGAFTTDDASFLEELGVPFAVALTTARLHREIVARERAHEELRLAAEIQRELQPPQPCEVPGLELEARLRPCREVGGDYWDLIPSTSHDRWWLVLADVSGKGVAAGLIASNIQAYFWSRRNDRRSLERVVAEGNDLLYRLAHGRKFATLMLVEWSPRRSRLTWVNGGHPPALVRCAGRVIELEGSGLPLGMLPDQGYTAGEIPFEPGDRLLMYTDGVFEAGAEARAGAFGLDRVRQMFESVDVARGVVDHLLAALDRHLGAAPPDDDLTMVYARRLDARGV
jgi:phosphoserine phosphatase